MRDETYFEHESLLDDDTRGGRWAPVLGAVAAMALLSGLIVWSYRLGVRDAQDVPVIRAMVGDIRIAPTDPGGLQVEHQDRRVYDAMARVVPAAPDTVQLAPPPEALAAEDLPTGRLVPETVASAADAPVPAEPLAPAMTEAQGIDDLVAAALAEPGPPGEARSPLPPLRPGRAAAAGTPPPAPVAAASASPFGPGTPAIQLGAYLSDEVARTMWRTLAARNGDLLAGREPVVDVIVGSTRTLHALRAAPFATMAEAQGLCAALRARSEDCLVTTLR